MYSPPVNAATFNEYQVFLADGPQELERKLNAYGADHYRLVHVELTSEGKGLAVMERVSASA